MDHRSASSLWGVPRNSFSSALKESSKLDLSMKKVLCSSDWWNSHNRQLKQDWEFASNNLGIKLPVAGVFTCSNTTSDGLFLFYQSCFILFFEEPRCVCLCV